jgi:hypothetical protein
MADGACSTLDCNGVAVVRFTMKGGRQFAYCERCLKDVVLRDRKTGELTRPVLVRADKASLDE